MDSLSLLGYQNESGRMPFIDWLESLRNVGTVARINARLTRVRLGNLGDHRTIRRGLVELRLAFGPGDRIYCAFEGATVVVLFGGGDKRTQTADISTAMENLDDYRKRIKAPGAGLPRLPAGKATGESE